MSSQPPSVSLQVPVQGAGVSLVCLQEHGREAVLFYLRPQLARKCQTPTEAESASAQRTGGGIGAHSLQHIAWPAAKTSCDSVIITLKLKQKEERETLSLICQAARALIT